MHFFFSGGKKNKLWTPAKISAALWLDAADATTIVLNGSTVSQWKDKSGNSIHANQANATNQPTYSEAGLNGKPTISFDGSNDFLVRIGVVANIFLDNSIFLAIQYRDATTLLQSVIATDVSESEPRMYLQANGVELKAYGGLYVPAGGIIANMTEITQFQRTTTNVINVFRDGTLTGTGASGTGSKNDGLIIGRLGNAIFGNYASVNVSELVFLNGTLPTADRQKLEGYLAHKWGLTANLPADHPYRAKPPYV